MKKSKLAPFEVVEGAHLPKLTQEAKEKLADAAEDLQAEGIKDARIGSIISDIAWAVSTGTISRQRQ